MSVKRLAIIAGLYVLSPAAQAQPDLRMEIEQGCLASTNWSEPACACIAEEAMDLTPDQQALLAASLRGEDFSAQAAKMTMPLVLEATMFMMKSGPACQ